MRGTDAKNKIASPHRTKGLMSAGTALDHKKSGFRATPLPVLKFVR
jgi:hypothetical protein